MFKELDIIKEYNLEYYYKLLLEKNTSNNLPYHNFYHTLTVVKNAFILGVDEKIKNLRPLILAALFHDFHHSGNPATITPDSDNVDKAIETFLEVSKEDEETNERVDILIRTTQFPHLPYYELTTEQKIIRDADLLQILEPNMLQQIVLGYGTQELKKTTDEFLVQEINFLKNLSFYTTLAKEMWLDIKEEIIESCEYTLEVLENNSI